MSAESIFGQLAAQDQARQQHDQATQGNAEQVFGQIAANGGNVPDATQAGPTPEQQQAEQSKNESLDRSEMLSGMTGMPVPGQDKAEFQRGKTAGMVSGLATIPTVAGATAAAPAIADTAQLASEYAEFFGKEGAQKIAQMAAAHPQAAKAVIKIVGGALAGHELGHSAAGALIGLLSSAL